MKRIFDVITIFAILQMVTLVLTFSVSYGILDNAVQSSIAWENMGGDASQGITDNATELTSSVNEIYNTVRAIGAGLIMVAIVVTLVTLSIKTKSGADIAGAKITIAFLAVLAVLFIFAKPIMDKLIELANDFKGSLV